MNRNAFATIRLILLVFLAGCQGHLPALDSYTKNATPVPGRIYAASPWVGIDGDSGSRDVLQAGCDAGIALVNGASSSRYRLWYEWYPGISNYISNAVIGAGDVFNATMKLYPART